MTLTGVDAAANPVSATTVTSDADGNYTFGELRPGTYTVTESHPAAYLDGIDSAGNAGGNTTVNDVISAIPLAAATNITGYDFGELSAGSIAGSVVDDSGDGIGGVTISLSGTDDLSASVSATTTTAADGGYSFEGLRPGTYAVAESQPAGYADGGEVAGTAGGDDSVDDVISAIVLGAGVDATGYDFDEATTSISGSVVDDSSVGIAGTTIALTGNDAYGDPVSLTTTTDAAGDYTFTSLLGGTYTITESQPVGYGDGGEVAGSAGGTVSDDVISGIVIAAGVAAIGYDFDETTGSLSGLVFEDLNNDGLVGVGEDGISGVTVDLTGSDDLGGSVSLSTTTAADGSYSFDGVLSGTYTITETQPSGYADGADTVGDSGGDATTTNDEISAIELTAGTDATNYRFGEIELSSLAGTVFGDSDNNGIADLGEPGLENVTLDLTGVDDLGQAVSQSTTTDADGAYAFADLRPGTYTITETQPTTHLDGIDTVGTSGGDDSTNDVISTIELAPFVNATGYDFAEVPPSSISGSVLDDTGTPIPATSVTVTGVDDLGQDVTSSTTTDADGAYTFPDLRPGTYTITETQPTGYGDGGETAGDSGGEASVDDVISGIAIAAGTDAAGYNFDEITGSLSGVVFHDRDYNGVDDDEAPIEGVTLTLTGTDDLGQPVSATTVTNADGTYLFDHLLSGTYTIVETQPAPYLDGTDTAGTAGGTPDGSDSIEAVALTPGDDATGFNFAELGNVIEGTVWLDTDRNGSLDPAEPGRQGGVVVTLVDGSGIVVGSLLTDADGSYALPSVPAGDYTVTINPPAEFGTTTPTTVEVAVPLGGLSDIDFGLDPASLTGIVWDDDPDGDGTRTTAEPGVEGVVVRLLDGDGNEVATTTTDSTGSYTFTDLAAGSYQVVVDPPDGLSLTTPDVGDDDTIDSDVDWVTDTVDVVIEAATDVSDVDAGLITEVIDLAVNITTDDSPGTVNDDVAYTVEATNTGNVPVRQGAVVEITVPDGLRLDGVDTDHPCDEVSVDCWQILVEGNTVLASWQGVLMPDETPPPIQIETTVIEDGSHQVLARVQTVDGRSETTTANNEASVSVDVAAATGPLAFTGFDNTLVLWAIALIGVGAFIRRRSSSLRWS